MVHRGGTDHSLRIEGGTIVFLNNTASRPDELFTLDPATGTARQLTNFNDELLGQLDFGKVEEYWFDGAAGDKVQGWLFYPPGFDAQKILPAAPAHARRPAHDGARRLELPLERARHGRAGLRRHLGQSPRLDRLRREVLPEHPQRVGRQAARGHPEEHRLPAQEAAQPRRQAVGRGRRQLRRLHGRMGRGPHGPVRLHHQPRRRERLHHAVRRGHHELRLHARSSAASRGRIPRACSGTIP